MPIVTRAARLICTTPEFDELARAVGLQGYQEGATDPAERARLRAELDAMVAHLYGLTEEEFRHILSTSSYARLKQPCPGRNRGHLD